MEQEQRVSLINVHHIWSRKVSSIYNPKHITEGPVKTLIVKDVDGTKKTAEWSPFANKIELQSRIINKTTETWDMQGSQWLKDIRDYAKGEGNSTLAAYIPHERSLDKNTGWFGDYFTWIYLGKNWRLDSITFTQPDVSSNDQYQYCVGVYNADGTKLIWNDYFWGSNSCTWTCPTSGQTDYANGYYLVGACTKPGAHIKWTYHATDITPPPSCYCASNSGKITCRTCSQASNIHCSSCKSRASSNTRTRGC